MEAFAITFHLASPIAAGEGIRPPYLMLDGLVGYAVAQERFGAGAYHRRANREGFEDLAVPLTAWAPHLYAASQGLAERGLRRLVMLTCPDPRANVITRVASGVPDGTNRTPPVVLPLTTFHTPRLTFFGHGEFEETLGLLRRHVHFLGHKRAVGFGHVTHITGQILDQDASWGRWDGERLWLHRPFPQEADSVLTALIDAEAGSAARRWWETHRARWPVDRLAWRMPYYLGTSATACWEPSHWGLAHAVPGLETLLAPRVYDEEDDVFGDTTDEALDARLMQVDRDGVKEGA